MSSMAPFTFIVMFCLISSCLVHGSSHEKATGKASDKKDILVETCQLCANNNPNVNYTFCVESLGSVPSSHHADHKGLAVIALNLAQTNAKDVDSKVKILLKAKHLTAQNKMRLETCLELYSDAMSRLKDSIKAVESSHHKDAQTWISSVVEAPDYCEEGFEEGGGEPSPLVKENEEFFKRATLALAITVAQGSSDQKNNTEASDSKDKLVEACQLCANNNPNVDYNFCVESLGSARNSHHADRKALAIIALNLAQSNAKDVDSKVKKLLKAKHLAAPTKMRLETCQERYSDAMSRLEDSIKAVESSQQKDAKTWISSAVDAPGDCEEGFKEGGGEASPLTKENDEFFKHATLALALTSLG